MAFLEIKGLCKRFGGLEVLKNIDIAVEAGAFLVLGTSQYPETFMYGVIKPRFLRMSLRLQISQ